MDTPWPWPANRNIPRTMHETARFLAIEECRPHSRIPQMDTFDPPLLFLGISYRGQYRRHWDFNAHCDPAGLGRTRKEVHGI
jgi:hypothetical protein